MNEAAVAAGTRDQDRAEILERILLTGDLSKLSPSDRVLYYRWVCESLGLNPLTRPFDYIVLNGRLVLYAKRDATDQLRRLHRINITVTGREQLGDLYVVTARATTAEGRTDEEIGAVATGGLRGDALANACMKATTKAKRRVTLSICGLGWLDETETETLHPEQADADAKTAPDQAKEAPDAGQAGPGAGAPAPRAASIAQRRMIHSVWRARHQLPDEDLRRWIAHHYRVTSTGELTDAQASEIIARLQKAPAAEVAATVRAVPARQPEAGAEEGEERS
jgi:hypothetical protein